MRSMNGAVGIFGASGYAGRELVRLLSGHGGVRLAFAASDGMAGRPVAEHRSALRYETIEDAVALVGEGMIALLATPAQVSHPLALRLLAKGCRVIDLSGAFRLEDPAERERHYGLPAAPGVAAVYGLPELFREEVRQARLVANPGCYPTAATLSLVPLLRAGWIDPSSLIVNAASGVTGAGRNAGEAFGFAEVAEDLRAYKVLRHQHQPEIAQTLSLFASERVKLTFTAHLLPLRRGILSTAYARLERRATSGELREVLESAYRGEAFVRVLPEPEAVRLRAAASTNLCLIGASCEPEAGGQVVVIAAIDNLLKGAAGQAVQNLNLMLGLDESSGLEPLKVSNE